MAGRARRRAACLLDSLPALHHHESQTASSSQHPTGHPSNLQLIVIYCCLILLSRLMANKPAALLCGQISLSALLGAGLAIGVQALTLAANGGAWGNNTATKVGWGKSCNTCGPCTA